MPYYPSQADQTPALSLAERRATAGEVARRRGQARVRLARAPRRPGHDCTTYDYDDESGGPLYQVCRFEPKSFRPHGSAGTGLALGLKEP